MMQLPLSAFLITMSLFLPNSCFIRLGLGVLSSCSSAMVASSSILLALGGIHGVFFSLKGCLLPGCLLFLRYAMHRCLARAASSD